MLQEAPLLKKIISFIHKILLLSVPLASKNISEIVVANAPLAAKFEMK